MSSLDLAPAIGGSPKCRNEQETEVVLSAKPPGDTLPTSGQKRRLLGPSCGGFAGDKRSANLPPQALILLCEECVARKGIQV